MEFNFEDVKNKIIAERAVHGKQVSEATLTVYLNNISAMSKMMNQGEAVGGFDWLEDTDKFINMLTQSKPNYVTRKNYLNAILSYIIAYNEDGSLKSILEKIEKQRDIYSKQYDEMNASGKWSQNQEKNMLSRDEFNTVLTQIGTEIKQKNLKKTLTANANEKALLQAYLLLNIHKTLPIRNELGNCLVMGKREFNKVLATTRQENNYLIIEKSKQTFYFNDYKTKKIYEERVIPVPNHLKKTIRFYLRFFPGDKYLICKFNGEPAGTNNVTQILTKQFKKRIGKSVSTTLLRKLYLSEKYSSIKSEQLADSHIMGHSVATASHIYTKPNPAEAKEAQDSEQVSESQ